MLNETIQTLRKQKGMTQEELAVRLHVVRQTVSKWEKGLSTPDAEMLQRIAEELEVSVQDLLGGQLSQEPDRNEIAQQLARLNEQLAVRNRRTSNIIKGILIGMAALLVLILGLAAAGMTLYSVKTDTQSTAVYTENSPTLFTIQRVEPKWSPDGSCQITLTAEQAPPQDLTCAFVLTCNGESTIYAAQWDEDHLTVNLGPLLENTSYDLGLRITVPGGFDLYHLLEDLRWDGHGGASWIERWHFALVRTEKEV